MDVAVERETKLDAGPEFALPDLRGLVPRAVVRTPQRLWSTYLDSRDLRLFDRRVTLRHRQGEGVGSGTWTLKLPTEDERFHRTRTELTWTGPVDSVPDDALHILRGMLRLEPLHVVAELECMRRRVALEDERGRSLGEVDHDTVTVHGGPRDGLRFHEVEVEAGTVDDRVAKVLRRLQDAAHARRKPARSSGGPSTGPDRTPTRTCTTIPPWATLWDAGSARHWAASWTTTTGCGRIRVTSHRRRSTRRVSPRTSAVRPPVARHPDGPDLARPRAGRPAVAGSRARRGA